MGGEPGHVAAQGPGVSALGEPAPASPAQVQKPWGEASAPHDRGLRGGSNFGAASERMDTARFICVVPRRGSSEGTGSAHAPPDPQTWGCALTRVKHGRWLQMPMRAHARTRLHVTTRTDCRLHGHALHSLECCGGGAACGTSFNTAATPLWPLLARVLVPALSLQPGCSLEGGARSSRWVCSATLATSLPGTDSAPVGWDPARFPVCSSVPPAPSPVSQPQTKRVGEGTLVVELLGTPLSQKDVPRNL